MIEKDKSASIKGKTKPIGVRFSREIVEEMKNIGVLTAQRVLNKLENYWKEKKKLPKDLI